MKKIIAKLLEIETKYKLNPLREVGLFMIILLVVHFLYRILARRYNFQIFGFEVIPPELFNKVAHVLFENSMWINKHILGLQFTTTGDSYNFLNPNFPIEKNPYIGWIGVGASCSGVKQLIQFLILMLLYPGPWKHKLWFIPSGLIIIHMVNIFRIVGLSVVVVTFKSQQIFTFSHDWLFRPFFYVVIFGMWVFWVEKIVKKQKAENLS